MSETKKETIEEKVIKLLRESFGREDITIKTDLISDLNVDSLDTVEIAMELEEEFNITIPDEDMEKLYSRNEAPVSKIITYIEEKVAEYSKK